MTSYKPKDLIHFHDASQNEQSLILDLISEYFTPIQSFPDPRKMDKTSYSLKDPFNREVLNPRGLHLFELAFREAMIEAGFKTRKVKGTEFCRFNLSINSKVFGLYQQKQEK